MGDQEGVLKNMTFGLIFDAKMGCLEEQKQACRIIRVAKYEILWSREIKRKLMPKGVQQIIGIDAKHVPRFFFKVLERFLGSRNPKAFSREKADPKI